MSVVDVSKGRDAEPTGRGTQRWLLHVGFIVTLAGFSAFYASTFASLIYIWSHDGLFKHAFLIIPVSLFLVWLCRDVLRLTPKASAPVGLIPLAGLCLLWLLGAASQVNLLCHFSIIAMLPCLVLTFYGWAVVRVLLFPLAYLFFAVPVGHFMVGPLQDITARISVFALQVVNMPVFLEGRILMTPAGSWHVEAACSGINFFFATTAFGVLYAWLFYQRMHRRLIFIACALVVPIIANGLRVFFTILIGEYLGMRYATGTDHMVFGWQFFGTVLVILFLAGMPWHEPSRVANVPNNMSCHTDRDEKKTNILALVILTLVLIAAAPVWVNATARMVTRTAPEMLTLPGTLGGLPHAGTLRVESGPGTAFRKADYYARARYGKARTPVLVNVAVYKSAFGEGTELITHGNRLFDDTVWKSVTHDSMYADLLAPSGVGVLQLERRHGDGGWLIWYEYRVNGHVTTSKIVVKLWRAWSRMLGRSTFAMVVTYASPVSDENAVASKRISGVAHDLSPWIQGITGARVR